MQKATTYSRHVHFSTVRPAVSESVLRTENLGVHLLCCCPRTNYEHLWTSVIDCMGYRQYGKWIHKSPSDQCKVILGLAVSNNGVALDNMSLSFWIYKLV